MDTERTLLLEEIEKFLAATGMGPSYFGKLAVGNSEIVSRLRANRRVYPETVAKARSFMEGGYVRRGGRGGRGKHIQGAGQDQAPSARGAAE
jgi:hypothetical protein